ncbi:MAG TPA: hypothetical protein VJ873_13065, partial [bacterium]|nr:hypothetical protein [bacterium]
PEVLPQAGDFANRFYGISYSNWTDTLTFLRAQMTGTTTQAMMDQYFPPSLQQQMQKDQLAEYFSSGPSAKVLGGSGDMAEVLVQGKVTTQTRVGRIPQTVSIKPVALLLTFRHAEGIGSKIEKVEEVDAHLSTGPQDSGQGLVVPSQGADVHGGTKLGSTKTVAAQAPNADLHAVSDQRESNPGKQIGDTVHNAHDAVNTAQEGTDAVDKAKKLLGF